MNLATHEIRGPLHLQRSRVPEGRGEPLAQV